MRAFRSAVLVAGLLGLTYPTVSGAGPADHFPDFASHAASLKRVVVLVEVTQTVDVQSGTDQFDLRVSRRIAKHAAKSLSAKLVTRGLTVKSGRVASIGASAAGTIPMVWVHAGGAVDSSGYAVLPADVDSALAGDGLGAWLQLVRRLSGGWRPSGDTLAVFTEATDLGRRFDCDGIVVLLMSGSRLSVARKFLMPPFEFNPANPSLSLRILDTRDGSLVWADDEITAGRLDNRMHLIELLELMANRIPLRR